MLIRRAWFVLALGAAWTATARAGDPPAADPKAVLTAMNETAGKVRSVSYQTELWAEGEIAKQIPKAAGNVQIVRGETPMESKINIEGTLTRRTRKESYRIATDGKSIVRVSADKKEFVHGALPAARALMGDMQMMIMPVFIAEGAIERDLKGDLKYEGSKSDGGVDCDVVHVSYAMPPGGESTWWVGRKDHLPRRFEQVVNAGGMKGRIIRTLTDVSPNPKLDESVFTPTAPAGYESKEFKMERPEPLAVGAQAPDWELQMPDETDKDGKTVSGRKVTLKGLRGRVVVLDFWATWCGPCRKVMPNIQKLHDKYKDKPVTVLGVSAWEHGGDPAKYMKEQKFTYGLLLDGDDVASDYKVPGLPTFYVIGPDGNILHTAVGLDPLGEEHFMATIVEVIDKVFAGKGGDQNAKTDK